MHVSSYLPREHGTYAELAFPLLSGLLLAPSPAGVAYAAACVAVFMAYEPAALLLGIRGVRLRAQLGEGARTRLFLWTGGAALAAVVAVLAARVHPRHLKRVGWTLVAAYTVSLGVMLAWRL